MRLAGTMGLALCLAFTASSAAFALPARGNTLATPLGSRRAALIRATVPQRPPFAGRRAVAVSASPLVLGSVTVDAAVTAASSALAVRGGAVVGLGGPASLLPPLWTLAVALATKQVMVALVCGIWSGCMLLHGLDPLVATLRTFDTHVIDAITDREHATVILFNLVLGGTIGLVQKGGGARGLAKALKRFAIDASSFMRTAACLSACIFFDDYASVLIVGNSFRPLLPLLGACREKFAMVLHFVAVAVSASMPVSSWVGMQVGCASAATAAIRASGAILPDPFVLAMRSLPYRLFPLALMAFVAALLATDRDFGPMADAVRRSTTLGSDGTTPGHDTSPVSSSLDPKVGTPLRAANALVPFGVLVAGTLAGMVVDGRQALAASGVTPGGLLTALSAGNSVKALLWGACGGLVTALALLLGQGILTLSEGVEAMVAGSKEVVEPVMVLCLAWALGGIIGKCGTADLIASSLRSGGLPKWGLPSMVALLSYAISFATGSSFGTMGILFPLVGPLAWNLGGAPVDRLPLLLHCFGATYGGALFGNVFSPIADTSILTALATRTNLKAHVSTSAPYACMVGGLCVLLGHLPMGLGLFGPFTALGLVMAAQTAILVTIGRKPKGNTGCPAGCPPVAVAPAH